MNRLLFALIICGKIVFFSTHSKSFPIEYQERTTGSKLDNQEYTIYHENSGENHSTSSLNYIESIRTTPLYV